MIPPSHAILASMQTTSLHKQGWVNFSLFIVLALLWSGSFLNIKIVVESLPPIFCSMIRVLVSLVSLGLLYTLLGKNVFKPKAEYWRIWIAGLFTQAIPFALLFYGERFIAPALASIINSTVAIWSLILGTIMFRDFSQWTPIKLGGILLGFIGITLVFAPFIHGKESNLIGIISVMGMSIAYAIGGLLNQHVIFKTMKVRFEVNLVQQHISSFLFLMAVSLSMEAWPSASSLLDTRILFAFLYLGVVATAMAWTIYFFLLKQWGTVRTTTVMYIVPMLAIVWDLLFLHIIPTHSELLGMVTILSGVTLIQWVKPSKVETLAKT